MNPAHEHEQDGSQSELEALSHYNLAIKEHKTHGCHYRQSGCVNHASLATRLVPYRTVQYRMK
jgi:hypothetical protein